ncbi:hypothetical protein M2262_005043 [Pseudomonas sp. BIGb0408]|uniref:DUF1302 domain-containing protein n=1 Tax=Phytopseudomonas flavescens TaxID=29435 RepID=A0A7Y9XQU6_9GAMM|nr:MULTISPECIES: DUF1302 domain-containing protein [Pseudomonas]MCW2294993.1 hypothetical protein [Pseudomonas sp. BIGb0408]NYH75733.1 hypothetical protein [Pseudomonas flavescens]
MNQTQHCVKASLLAFAVSMNIAAPAQAAQIDLGSSDWQLRWDNTLKYSQAWRLHGADDRLTDASTAGGLYPSIQGQGDKNFSRGLVSNRLDILSEVDLSHQNYGMRVSGAAWYDHIYNQDTDSSEQPRFLSDTRELHGRDAELLDAFVYLRGDLGEVSQGVLRLGRHSLVYGESLFYGGNGIGAAQGPTDVVKLLSVPGTQFKEILRPVNQISGQLQINPQLSIGAYYQFDWERSSLPGAGSYLSDSDAIGEGSGDLQQVFGNRTVHGKDIEARNGGQGGMQIRFKPEGTELELGLYAAKYHDKAPSGLYAYIDGPAAAATGLPILGEYRQVFAEDIKTVGASFSTAYGDFNFAGETSIRWDAPLVSNLQVVAPGQLADNADDALYAKGRTAHVNLSTIYLLPPSALWDGGSVLAELAWNRTLSVTDNRAALDGNTTRDATALRVLAEPAYFQVADGVDLSVPIGIGMVLDGRSSAVSKSGFGNSHAGDWSVGLKATYLQRWEAGLNYVNFFGATGAGLNEAGDFSYQQSLADRDFVSLYVKTTF